MRLKLCAVQTSVTVAEADIGVAEEVVVAGVDTMITADRTIIVTITTTAVEEDTQMVAVVGTTIRAAVATTADKAVTVRLHQATELHLLSPIRGRLLMGDNTFLHHPLVGCRRHRLDGKRPAAMEDRLLLRPELNVLLGWAMRTNSITAARHRVRHRTTIHCAMRISTDLPMRSLVAVEETKVVVMVTSRATTIHTAIDHLEMTEATLGVEVDVEVIEVAEEAAVVVATRTIAHRTAQMITVDDGCHELPISGKQRVTSCKIAFEPHRLNIVARQCGKSN